MRNHLLGTGMLASLMLGTLALPAAAAPMTLTLTPADMLAQTHSHAIIMTVTGTFRQLSGKLNFDPATKSCDVDVTFVVESLALPNALIRSQTMSSGFLDPAEYPTQHYVGTCQGDRLVGNLTMRGQTHPFDMDITSEQTGGQVTGLHLEGQLNRYDWGLNGLSMTVGKVIRVTNDISLNGQPPVPPAS
jgi:polyisoprenoid-binding protein YceI